MLLEEDYLEATKRLAIPHTVVGIEVECDYYLTKYFPGSYYEPPEPVEAIVEDYEITKVVMYIEEQDDNYSFTPTKEQIKKLHKFVCVDMLEVEIMENEERKSIIRQPTNISSLYDLI